MIIGVLQIELHIPHAASLKNKRAVLKSIKDRLRNRFNVSVSEVDYCDKWQRSVLAIVTVSSDTAYVSGALDKVERFFDTVPEVCCMDRQRELL